ncbi:hypothetical protein BDN70DRAFT_921479 [Pholiota conissans]|uniref:Uncharacterized protein n=1 Tax=Pholiota conissans TaxID=109636 RepID=A0A9P5Z3D1_9AGAR|nr:hypothetical protein BDN70DRAFT_921479 [Pholiota conissans]
MSSNAELPQWKEDLLAFRRAYFPPLETDEDVENYRELNRFIDKITETKPKIQRPPFSNVSFDTLNAKGITVYHGLDWRPDGATEAIAYGRVTSPGARTVEDTRRNVDEILKYVFLKSSEAGCGILVNTLLMHIASNLETDESGFAIVPEYRAEDTPPEGMDDVFGGIVDYMLFYGDKRVRDEAVRSIIFPFTDLNRENFKFIKCNIYEAKPLSNCLPQAMMAAIIKARHLQLNVFRGCVTNGKKWVFFIYNAEDPTGEDRQAVHWLGPINLGTLRSPTGNLEAILGVLRDWVEHTNDNHLRFFKY